MNQIKENFELFDLQVRRLRNGNKLRVVLERTENIEIEKKFIEFRYEKVKAKITALLESGQKGKTIEGNFEVFDIKVRSLRNGNKLCVILEALHDKDLELDIVKYRYEEVVLELEKVQGDLIEDDDDEVIEDVKEVE